MNCSYPSDQRSLQSVFPNSTDNGLNHRVNTKAKNPNMQQKARAIILSKHGL